MSWTAIWCEKSSAIAYNSWINEIVVPFQDNTRQYRKYDETEPWGTEIWIVNRKIARPCGTYGRLWGDLEVHLSENCLESQAGDSVTRSLERRGQPREESHWGSRERRAREPNLWLVTAWCKDGRWPSLMLNALHKIQIRGLRFPANRYGKWAEYYVLWDRVSEDCGVSFHNFVSAIFTFCCVSVLCLRRTRPITYYLLLPLIIKYRNLHFNWEF